MRSIVPLGLLACSAAIFAFHAERTHRLALAKDAWLDGLGTCSIEPASLECWDMDAKRDPSLTESVRKGLLTPRIPPLLPVRQGSKVRFFVVSQMNRSYEVTFGADSRTRPLPLNETDSECMYLVPFTVIPGVSQMDLAVKIGGWPKAAKGQTQFREGGKVKVGDVSVTVGRVTHLGRNPGSFYFITYPRSTWSVVIGWNSNRRDAIDSLRFQAIGRDGKPVVGVDVQGKPVSDSVFKAWNDAYLADPTNTPPTYQRAFISGSMARLPDAAIYYTNIDPASVSGLRVTLLTTQNEMIRGFPLDPRP
jgi:hypothetical protein